LNVTLCDDRTMGLLMSTRARLGPVWLLAWLAVAGCDRATPRPLEAGEAAGERGLPTPRGSVSLASVTLTAVPFVKQKPDFCGEACIEMAARRLGKGYDQDAVFAQTGLDPALGRGAYTKELVLAAQRLGFEPGQVWSQIDAHDPAPGLGDAFAALHADLVRGVPSIVCMHYDERPNTTEHFRLVVGYDQAADEVVYHEPAEEAGAYRRMKRDRFEDLWPLKYDSAKWSLVRIALSPGKLAEPAPATSTFSPADYAQHVMKLRERLEEKKLGKLNIRIEEPFVVVGNDSPDVLAKRAQTVRWAADHLEKDFFQKRPSRILDVYLFNDETSYDRGVAILTGSAPTTPYGFYSSTHAGLFMNIATGGGTLVHEIVHPYVEADLLDAPAWLNEGLGSLFEQSAEREGHIIGLTNWRLAGLQRAIKRDQVPTFAALAAMSDRVFYDQDRGTNYAQARYLFHYMQERGQLVPFYKAYRAAQKADPSGYATLQKVLGEKDMADFKLRWQEYVLGLRFN